MKRGFLLFLLILRFSFLFAQNNADSVIKALKVSKITINEGERTAGTLAYNTYGNLIYDKYNNFAGSTYLVISSVNVYNKNQQLIETKTTRSPRSTDTTIQKLDYDAKGSLISIKNNGHVVFDYTYDVNGRKIKESMPDLLGNIIYEMIIEYNKQGDKSNEILRFKSSLDKNVTYYYDDLNRIIKEESIQDNKKIFATTFLYFKKTKILIKVIYDEDGTGTSITGVRYEYDLKSRLIKRLHFKLMSGKETISGREFFEYFDNNLIKSYTEDIFTATSTERHFVYSYTFFL